MAGQIEWYIKIMFAAFYSQGKSVRIDDIIQVASEDIFRYVDEFGRDAVYEYLEKAYDKAESIIPTKFKNYENRTRDEKSETCTFHIKFNNNELVRSDTVSIFKELTIEN